MKSREANARLLGYLEEDKDWLSYRAFLHQQNKRIEKEAVEKQRRGKKFEGKSEGTFRFANGPVLFESVAAVKSIGSRSPSSQSDRSLRQPTYQLQPVKAKYMDFKKPGTAVKVGPRNIPLPKGK